jgi:hypothetical protein
MSITGPMGFLSYLQMRPRLSILELVQDTGQTYICDVGKPIRNRRHHRFDDRLIHKTQKNVLKGGRDTFSFFK